MDARFLVVYDADAVREFESLKGKRERNAVYAVVEKLQMVGPDLKPPHVKSLKGEGDCWSCGRAREARPCGRSAAGSGSST